VSSRSPGLTRALAIGALAAVVLVIALLLFSGGGGADYHLIFPEADQLVRGDQVQVGGVPVGSITDIVLTHDYTARVTIHVDSSLTPLYEGTTAAIRVPSLSGVANRYIALTPGPNSNPKLPAGATLPTSATKGAVDLDQLFNIFNAKTRRGLQEFVQGSAEQYAGASASLNAATRLFPPSIGATEHVFAEFARDQQTFTSFLVETARALTVIGARHEQLTDLVGNADKTFEAIGSQQASLAAGLQELPVTLRAGNKTFVELPPTLAALTELVNVSKPDTKQLAPFFARLNSFQTTATPVLHDLSLAVSRPGPANDFTDVALALPALARELETSSPATVASLREAVPIVSYFRPYTPELVGWLRSFGQTASNYDANGHYIRASPAFDEFTLGSSGNLTVSTAEQALANLRTRQLRRCPGAATQPAADGSSPFTEGGRLGCNPGQVPG